MITLVGTDKIRGVLDLSTVKKQIAKGQIVYIKDDEFWQSDVQIALKMGWISAKGQKPKPQDVCDDLEWTEKPTKTIKFINVYHGHITMRQINKEIKPGQEFYLNESDTDSPDIKAAIAKGMIKIAGVVSMKATDEEGSIKVLSSLDDLTEGTPDDTNLDTNEEIDMPTTIVRDKKGVVWNKDVTSKIIEAEDPPPADPNEGDPKQSSIVVDPNKDRLNSYISSKQHDITFVDELHKQEKRKTHPKLKDKEEPKPSDPELISDDHIEQERIASHPILGKKGKKNSVDSLETLDGIKNHPVLQPNSEVTPKNAE